MDKSVLEPAAKAAEPVKWGRLILEKPDGLKNRKFVAIYSPEGIRLGTPSPDSCFAVWRFITSHPDPAVAVERLRLIAVQGQASESSRTAQRLAEA